MTDWPDETPLTALEPARDAPDWYVARCTIARLNWCDIRGWSHREGCVHTVGEVRRLTDADLLARRSFGVKRLQWLRSVTGPYRPPQPLAVNEPDLDFEAHDEPDPSAVSPSLAPQQIRAALRELVDERNRYREALVEIYRFRREHTEQPAHVAWHIVTVDIPEICRVALNGEAAT